MTALLALFFACSPPTTDFAAPRVYDVETLYDPQANATGAVILRASGLTDTFTATLVDRDTGALIDEGTLALSTVQPYGDAERWNWRPSRPPTAAPASLQLGNERVLFEPRAASAPPTIVTWAIQKQRGPIEECTRWEKRHTTCGVMDECVGYRTIGERLDWFALAEITPHTLAYAKLEIARDGRSDVFFSGGLYTNKQLSAALQSSELDDPLARACARLSYVGLDDVVHQTEWTCADVETLADRRPQGCNATGVPWGWIVALALLARKRCRRE